MAGKDVGKNKWRHTVDSLEIAIELEVIPHFDENYVYEADERVLIRPEDIIGDHWLDEAINDEDVDAQLTAVVNP